MAVVLVAVLPQLLVLAALYAFFRWVDSFCFWGGKQTVKARRMLPVDGHAMSRAPPLQRPMHAFPSPRHKAYIRRLVQSKEAELERKRGRVPGTPGVTLQDGRGLLALSDVQVR